MSTYCILGTVKNTQHMRNPLVPIQSSEGGAGIIPILQLVVELEFDSRLSISRTFLSSKFTALLEMGLSLL